MSFDNIKHSSGFFEHITYKDGQLSISGWMFHFDLEYDKLAFYINGEHIMDLDIQTREAVGETYPKVPHAANSGFNFKVPCDKDKVAGIINISLIGMNNGQMAAKMETLYSSSVEEVDYPTKQMQRVSHTEDVIFFRTMGFKTFSDFWKVTQKHTETSQIKNMLDWGCGCGRLTPLIKNIAKIPNIYGCDIDKDAINWCKGYFKNEHFENISAYPPTRYQDNQFDLILSYSVLTHLTKDVQLDWLKEIKRILAPGGLFIATVHGDFAMEHILPESSCADYKEMGINDEMRDDTLGSAAPKDYYRATFQTEKYTRRVYEDYFTILDYLGAGASSYQDIIVMKSNKPIPKAQPFSEKNKQKGFFKKIFKSKNKVR